MYKRQVTKVPIGDHQVVLMDANAKTGERQSGCADSKVPGTYGRDELNDNGERLLLHAANNKLALFNRFCATPNPGISYTFQSANSGEGQSRLDYTYTTRSPAPCRQHHCAETTRRAARIQS